MTDLYRPPAPQPMTPLRSLLRVIRQGDGDLLSLVPGDAYEKPCTYLGYSRRSILLVNDPQIAKDVLTDPLDIFPKNDLMVGALQPLVGAISVEAMREANFAVDREDEGKMSPTDAAAELARKIGL